LYEKTNVPFHRQCRFAAIKHRYDGRQEFVAMRDPILVINAGSSSLKFSVFEPASGGSLSQTMRGQVEGIGTSATLCVTDARGQERKQPVKGSGYDHAMAAIQDWFAGHAGGEAGFGAVGHRIVHGGSKYCEPALIDEALLAGLQELVPLAPLHEPHQIDAIRAISAAAPNARQVACFDTAFHSGQPSIAREFALPREFSARGIRRYGFHGLSYEYIVSALPRVAPECVGARLVVAHLGNGASLCAIEHGRSVATTMGLTALDGVPMGTRCGTLDPGVLLYLLQHEHMSASEIEHLLYERSGLLGVSGISSDMRALLESDAPSAKEALDLFVYWIGREIGSLAAAMGGLDALIFTGGIGENAYQIRSRACQQARWLGIELDVAANVRAGPRISTEGSRTSAWVIPTNENLIVAQHTRRVLKAA
jgi:acetate kinase